MSSSLPLPLPRHAEAPTPSTTASACLLCPRSRLSLSLSLGSCRAAAKALAAASPSASGLAYCRHASVAAPSPRPSTPRSGGGLLVLTVAVSAVAISASFIFLSAIRSMLDCKRAAECLQKSFDSTREKLPETMVSFRLVGREVSDLTMDLSDLRRISQELRKGVKSSISIVHTAEAQLHQLTTSSPQGIAPRVANRKKSIGEPLLASTVRELRELIADTRSGFGVAFGIASLLMWASKFRSKRPKNCT